MGEGEGSCQGRLGPGAFHHSHWPYNFANEDRLGRWQLLASTPHGEWLRLPIEIGALGCLFAILMGLALWRAGATGRHASPPPRRRSRADVVRSSVDSAAHFLMYALMCYWGRGVLLAPSSHPKKVAAHAVPAGGATRW